MSTDKTFNLLREPWILVMNEDGSTQELGLIETFERACEIRRLAGELPTQDIAVLRLLLAILHAVYGRYAPNGTYAPIFDDGSGSVMIADALTRWQALWDSGRLAHHILHEYLEKYEDRFWLFHPERPFYQVPNLTSGTVYDAAKLNGEVNKSGNKERLFSPRSGDHKYSLSFAEAARWLIHINGFDDSSNKPTRGMNLPAVGTGWLGKLGLVVAVGNNLFETLMFNLVFLQDGNKLWKDGKAVWELDKVRTAERSEIPHPKNPAELLTLQSRRIRLVRDGDRVIQFRAQGGDFFKEENAFVEQMTVWKKENQEQEIYLPKQHNVSRQVWRDFASLFVNKEGQHSPGVVSWLKQLKFRKFIPHTHFKFQIAAIEYDAKKSSFADVFSDGISFHADVLNTEHLGEAWIDRILHEIETTELLVQQTSWFARYIAEAIGGKDSDIRRMSGEARMQAYFRLDRPFRQWLESIDPLNDEPVEASLKWWETAKRIIRRLGSELLAQCDSRFFVERIVKKEGDKKATVYSIPRAYNTFLYRTYHPDHLRGGKKNGTRKRQAN